MVKDIGGYLELEIFQGRMMHEDSIKLNSGRDCLAYLIRAREIKRLLMPSFMCDVVLELCAKYGVQLVFYKIGIDFRPEGLVPDKNVYLYLANYYGQLSADEIKEFTEQFKGVILDNAQDYYAEPITGIDTLYTCRKFFGVPDGGLLYTSAAIDEVLPQAKSFGNMKHILGRFEKSASDFYELSIYNNERFDNEPLMTMSKLTENLLRAVDYERAELIRRENFLFLHNKLSDINKLVLIIPKGPFAYPLLISEGSRVRKELQKRHIYVPVLWPNVANAADPGTLDYDLSVNILPLPCDQRYGIEEMQFIIDTIYEVL